MPYNELALALGSKARFLSDSCDGIMSARGLRNYPSLERFLD